MKKVFALFLSLIMIAAAATFVNAAGTVALKSLKLNVSATSIQYGGTYSLKLTLNPSNTTQKTVTYSSDNKKVATVDGSGKITANGVGTAKITAVSTANTNIMVSCIVTVTAIPITFVESSTAVESMISDTTKKYIQDNFGIAFTLNLVADSYQQKYSLLISSGNIPDLQSISPLMYSQYAAQGAYTDITGKVKDLPDIQKYVTSPDYWTRITVNNKLYGIPELNTAGKYNLIIRKDWLDQDKLAVPKTYDQFVNVLKAFTDPKNGVYGFGTNEGTSGPSYTNLMMFCGMYGAAPNYYTVNNNQVDIGDISTGYENALKAFKSLYDAGYIDPEIFTEQTTQFQQKVVQNKIGCWVGWWSDIGQYYGALGWSDANPNGVLLSIPAIQGPTGQAGMNASDPMPNVMAIGAKCKNVDVVLKFLNWCTTTQGYRTCMYSPYGFTTKADGSLDYYYNVDPSRKLTNGVVVPAGQNPQIWCWFIRTDIYPEQLNGPAIQQQKSHEGYVTARDNPLLTNAFLGLTSDAYVNDMPNIQQYVQQMEVKFILGDESFDNWGAYINQYKSLGGLDVANSLLDAYNKLHNTQVTLKNY